MIDIIDGDGRVVDETRDTVSAPETTAPVVFQPEVNQSYESARPQRGVEKFLATLEPKNPGDDELLAAWRADLKIADEASKRREIKQDEVLKIRDKTKTDPEISAAYNRDMNEVIKGVLPTVSEHVATMLERIPDMEDSPRDFPHEYLTGRAQDLARLARFESADGGNLSDQEITYAIALIQYITEPSRLRYKKGLQRISNMILKESGEQFGPESRVDEESNNMQQALVKNGARLHHAIYDRFDIGDIFPHEGLDYWERRVNPQFYNQFEDKLMHVPKSVNEKLPDRA